MRALAIASLIACTLRATLSAHQCDMDVDCDDLNLCTDDVCDVSGTFRMCTYTYNALSCNDGDVCTVNDGCAAGVCVGDHVLSSTCSIPGKTCIAQWLFIMMLLALAVVGFLLMYMCVFARTPRQGYGQQYPQQYQQAYAQPQQY